LLVAEVVAAVPANHRADIAPLAGRLRVLVVFEADRAALVLFAVRFVFHKVKGLDTRSGVIFADTSGGVRA
jgi:hypothetical protein